MGAPTRRQSRSRKLKKQASDRPPVVPFTPDDDGALCYVRQSHFTDESTSSEVQTEITHRWANGFGVPIIDTVEDLHVSGDLEPHKRDGLKEWLSDAPPQPWKTLVVSKLDRLVRNVMDALVLLQWVKARGKRLICIAEGIDSSNSMSEFMITLCAAFARMERERMRERFLDSKAALKELGRWAGEAHVYGTKPVALPGGGWVLGLDPYAVKILHSLSNLARSGTNLTDMCEWLASHNVVSPKDRQAQLTAERRGEDPSSVELKGYPWSGTALKKLLTNPDLVDLGIFEPAEQAEIVARLDERSKRKTRGSNRPYEFSGILVCPDCLEPLWHQIIVSKKTLADGSERSHTYHYWRCHTCKTPSMRAEDIEPLAEQAFYRIFESVPVRERVVVPPTDHANEIAKLERKHAKLMAGIARAAAGDRQKIQLEGDKILEDIDTLRALPVDPGGIKWVATDRTWREELVDMLPDERRARWIELGYEFAIQKGSDGTWRAGWRLPDDWRNSMPELRKWVRKISDGGIIDITDMLDWAEIPAEN